MPIRPENIARYPANWRDITALIRARAGNQCECTGECRRGTHTGRCPNMQNQPAYGTGSTVVLTTAHMDHVPENCDGMEAGGPALPVGEANLRAFCNGCHLHYDLDHHKETRYRVKRALMNMADLFELEERVLNGTSDMQPVGLIAATGTKP